MERPSVDCQVLLEQTIASDKPWLEVNIASQRLYLRCEELLLRTYRISTALNGPGEEEGSGCTPRGWHYVRARIGVGMPEGTVFVGRRPTGEIYSEQLARDNPQRDWILTRILWLCGLEPGVNRLGSRDSMRRYIYFHGCPDTCEMGKPGSKGCIRMRNRDVIEVFDRVLPGTRVVIRD